MTRSELTGVLFFCSAALCVANPDYLPMRDWFHGLLDVVFGWMK